ncbi:MAG: redoxin domain-containing protein [Planctomycetia bacterium]|nr:redoxin domain-containing protein [Planctomycetia bacterium]
MALPHRAARQAPRTLRYPTALLLLSALAVAGCNHATSTPIEAPLTAREVLEKMANAYRTAKSYDDSGQLRLTFRKQGEDLVSQTADDSVAFERPNKLRMHCYQAIVVSDGKQLRATVADLPGQVLDVEAPAELRREDLYADEILAGVLTRGLAGESTQLALLLLPDSLAVILDGAEAPSKIEDQSIDGADCYRIVVKRPDGQITLWIDQENYVLRKIAYPTDSLKKQISDSVQAPVTEVSLVAEFKGAHLNGKIADVAFAFDAPTEAKLVKRFQIQPEPLPKLLGKKIGAFEFVDLSGNPVTRDSLSGKIVVIDFWATWCEWCFKGLPNLQQVYEKYEGNDRVAILAVSTDDPQTTAAELRESFTKAQLTIPILRDAREQSRSMFEVQGLPTMFLLGPDGTIEAMEIGFQPRLAVDLPRKLDKLLAGESLYKQARAEYEARQKAFEDSLASGNQAAADDALIPQATIAPKSEPAKLTLEALWHSDEATRPGNILAFEESDGRTRLLVNDGWRTIVELDGRGQLAARHELDIPNEAAISYLRTATDAQGSRYFAGSASAQQQLFLFDASFKKLLAFPEGEHAGISDVRLADLDGDGQVDINVGYWGVVGVQCVATTGERRWADRALENVFCLAVTGPDAAGKRGLLAADGRGTLVPIDYQGKEDAPLSISGLFLRWLAVTDLDGDGQAEICAIASAKAGVESAIGLSPAGTLLWQYDLPVGAQPNAALEMIAAGRLLGDTGQWVVSGADGSIHILSPDGKPIDRFNVGAAIGGLSVAPIDGKGAIVVGTDNGVDAWRVQ